MARQFFEFKTSLACRSLSNYAAPQTRSASAIVARGSRFLPVRQMDLRTSLSSLASIERVHELKVQERAAPRR